MEMEPQLARRPLEKEEENELEAIEQNDIYEKEIEPLLRILKPEGVSFEEYESQVMDELYDDMKKIQSSKGVLMTSPEQELSEIKNLLDSRIRSITLDARDSSRKEVLDAFSIKKARLAQLSEGDYSDFEKYFGKKDDPREIFGIDDAYHYLGDTLNADDIDVLMKTDLGPSLAKTNYYQLNARQITEIPESLLRPLAEYNVENNNYLVIDFALKHAKPATYSKEAFEQLIDDGYGQNALGYIDKFQDIPFEKIGSSKNLFVEKTDRTLDYLNKIESSEKKEHALKQGFITYLSGRIQWNFLSILQKFNLSEEVLNSTEVHGAALHAIERTLSEGKTTQFDGLIENMIDVFHIEPEELLTPALKQAASTYIQQQLIAPSSSNGFFNKESIKNIVNTFDIPVEEVQQIALIALPLAFKNGMDSKQLLDYVGTYNISESNLTPEARESFIESFIASIKGSTDFETPLELIEQFPFLQTYFDENNPINNFFDTQAGKIQETNKDINVELKLQKLQNIKESFQVAYNKETLPKVVQEKIEEFVGKYGKKGQSLIALAVVGSGLENPESFVRKMTSIEKILDRYNPETIPQGSHVSMGIEYEVMHSIAKTYEEESALGYKGDVNLISRGANIGAGIDGVHEFAIKPTYNPYMLLAEVKLMQEAGLLDLNFEKYPQAARGYHLSLVGDNGLKINENICFLQNLLTMTELTGVLAGKEISNTKTIHSKSFDMFSDVKQKGTRCEFKGMACDTVEQFEKAVISSHHAGIAIQVAEKYLLQEVLTPSVIGDNPEEFEHSMETNNFLRMPFESDQERDIAFQWLKLKNDIVLAIKEHNDSFIDSEFRGFVLDSEGNYTDTAEHIDIMRNKNLVDEATLKSENFKDFIRINPVMMFTQPQPSFTNALIRTNNIFLKPPQDAENSPVNARAMLDVVKEEGYGDIQNGKPTDSIFDRQGEFRDGYYVIQGASEEMISHKSQIILNRFNKRMEELMKQAGVKRNNMVNA